VGVAVIGRRKMTREEEWMVWNMMEQHGRDRDRKSGLDLKYLRALGSEEVSRSIFAGPD
jgi:hypothetical protein